MKKRKYLPGIVLVLLLMLSLTSYAASFDIDGSYLYGQGKNLGLANVNHGFVVHAMAELLTDVLVDGSFLHTNVTKLTNLPLPEGEYAQYQLMSGGGLYRVVNDRDLKVYVGAGYIQLARKAEPMEEFTGHGIYGKFGFKFMPLPKLQFVADLSYAPKYKVANDTASLTTARATISYKLYSDLALQGTVKYYNTELAKNTLFGGGLSFSF